ncbi:MAG: di-heme oxidoredictase family protein [Cellvibrionaceae bacterium]
MSTTTKRTSSFLSICATSLLANRLRRFRDLLITTPSHLFLTRPFSRLWLSAVIAAPLLSLPATADDTRVKATGHNAFSRPAANMPIRQRLDFSVGNSFFRNPWVAAPSSTKARDGLGPLFNTNACQNCHIKDGRGHAPSDSADSSITSQQANVSMLVRLSVDSDQPLAPHQANHVDPHYGGQLQDFALPGLKPEGIINVNYQYQDVTLNGGETVQLRQPTLGISQLAYGSLHPNIRLSARIAPPMIGLGLLEAIGDERLSQLADANDNNDDGISGRLNLVWDNRSQSLQPGRFGWKAGQPSLEQQNAAAFNGDMGITSSLFRQENCQTSQITCHQRAAHGNGLTPKSKPAIKAEPKPAGESKGASKSGPKPEVAPHLLNQVTFYTGNLAVPKRRTPQDSRVKAGEAIFAQLNCDGCHTSSHTTRADYHHPWLANQSIKPYTDLLLHDMGEGLADHSQEFLASGREWRTPPLWGIGLTQAVSGVESYLHDGRARNLQEAILWHGGEAQRSRDLYQQLAPEQRQALLAFLRDL